MKASFLIALFWVFTFLYLLNLTNSEGKVSGTLCICFHIPLYLLVFASISISCEASYRTVHNPKGSSFSDKRYTHTIGLELHLVSFFLLYSFVFISLPVAAWLCFHDLLVLFRCNSVFHKQHIVQFAFFFFHPNWKSFNRIVSWQSEEWIVLENTPAMFHFLLISVVAVFPERFS